MCLRRCAAEGEGVVHVSGGTASRSAAAPNKYGTARSTEYQADWRRENSQVVCLLDGAVLRVVFYMWHV